HKRTTFVIFDENVLDKYAIDKGSIMKNDDRRGNEFVDFRYVKGNLIKDDNIDDGEKKKGIINLKMNFDESNQMGKMKDESAPDMFCGNNKITPRRSHSGCLDEKESEKKKLIN
ncbi:17054_t:CDS:1, partial [Gigaspora rosea]